MVVLENAVVLATAVADILDKVDKTKVRLLDVDEGICEDVVVVLPCGNEEGKEKFGAVEIIEVSSVSVIKRLTPGKVVSWMQSHSSCSMSRRRSTTAVPALL